MMTALKKLGEDHIVAQWAETEILYLRSLLKKVLLHEELPIEDELNLLVIIELLLIAIYIKNDITETLGYIEILKKCLINR